MAADDIAIYHAATERALDTTLRSSHGAFDYFFGGGDRLTEEALDRFLAAVAPQVLAVKSAVARFTSIYTAARTAMLPKPIDIGNVFERAGFRPANMGEASDMIRSQYSRPFVEARTALARGKTHAEAIAAGQNRLDAMINTDAQMSKVRQAQDSLQAAGVTHYRRVTHSTSPCPLCLIASTQTYNVKNLAAIHQRCVPGDSLVTVPAFQAGTAGDFGAIKAATRRWYAGDLVELSTASGHLLRVTPNHPVLTEQGWLPAGLIRQGDTVFRSRRSERPVDSGPHVGQTPTPIEDVFAAVSVAGRLERMPLAAEDFHADAPEGEVEVVWADRNLAPVRDGERGGELCFMHTHLAGVAFATGGDLATVLQSDGLAARSLMGGGGAGVALFGSHLGHGQAVGLGTPARFDPAPYEFVGDGLAAYADRGRNLQRRLAGQIEADSVIETRLVCFTGHVYNLETSEGWYTANSHIVSNCRCDVDIIPPGMDVRQIVVPDNYLDQHATGSKAEQIASYLRKVRDEEDYDTGAIRELIEVREHGEIGPVLTWRDQHFTGIPQELAVRHIGVDVTEVEKPLSREEFKREAARILAGGEPTPPRLDFEEVTGPVTRPHELVEGWQKLGHKVKLTGFNDIEFDSPAQEQFTTLQIRDFLQGTHELLQKYPALEDMLPEIRWGGTYYTEGITAETWPTGQVDKHGHVRRIDGTDSIRLAPDFFKSPDSAAQMQGGWERLHPLSPWQEREALVIAPNTPIGKTVAYHEIGHVIDNASGKKTNGQLAGIISNEWEQASTPEMRLGPNANRDKMDWLSREMSAYGRGVLTAGGGSLEGVNAPEAVAEAFADVELNGRNATWLNQSIYRELMYNSKVNPIPSLEPPTGGVPYREFEPEYIAGSNRPGHPPKVPVLQPEVVPARTATVAVADASTVPPPPTKLEWDGPPVAEPIDPSDEMWWDVVEDWSDPDRFDAIKDDLRAGVRDVQKKGYAGAAETLGLPSEDDWDAWDAAMTERGMRGDEIGTAFLELTSRSGDKYVAEGRELAALAVHSPPTTRTLYRGMGMTGADLDSMLSGDELSLPLSSFTTSQLDAAKFAEGTGWWKSRDRPKDARSVVFQLEKGAKAPLLNDDGASDEWLAFGRFRIVNRQTKGDRTVVTLKQVSMREALPPSEARGAVAEIPDITVLQSQRAEPDTLLGRIRARVDAQIHPGRAPSLESPDYGDTLKRLPLGTEIKAEDVVVYKYDKAGNVKTSPVYLEEHKGGRATGKMVPVLDENGQKIQIGTKPQIDWKKTWDRIPDETLRENWRLAMRQSEAWAWESGKVWYPEVGEFAGKMASRYGSRFKEIYGIDLNDEIVAVAISEYSKNNKWAGNLVGVRQFLTGENDSDHMHQDGIWAAIRYDPVHPLRYFEARRLTAPKPFDFASDISGHEDRTTVDRWVARIMLHTGDDGFAEDLRTASYTKDKKPVPFGYDRMSRILSEVAAEPEFAGLSPEAVQAIPWVHVVGPVGSVGDIDLDLLDQIVATSEHPVADVMREFERIAEKRWGGMANPRRSE